MNEYEILTEEYDMQRQPFAEKRDHGLSMPEIVNVRHKVAHTLYHQPMKYCSKPQIHISATRLQSCKLM